MDPQICRVVHHGNQLGMGFTAITLGALLTSGMRLFIHRRNADQRAKEAADKRKAELMDPEVLHCSVLCIFSESYTAHLWCVLLVCLPGCCMLNHNS